MPNGNPAVLDGFYKGKAYGEVADHLAEMGLNANVMRQAYAENRIMRGNATLLREKEWERLDNAVVHVAHANLQVVNFFRTYGGGQLVYPIEALDQTVLSYDTLSDGTPAELGMEIHARTEGFKQKFIRKYMPVPVAYKDYDIGIRELRMSRNLGSGLDTGLAEAAGFYVTDLIEDVFVNGRSTELDYGGGKLYGLLDFEHTHEVQLNGAWTASGITGDDMLEDLQNLIQACVDDYRYGPYAFFIPEAWRTAVTKRYNVYDSRSIAEVIRSTEKIVHFDLAHKLPANVPLLVDLSPMTLQVVVGMPVSNIPWEGASPFEPLHHKVIGCILPRPRVDQDGRCGIAKGTV